MSTAIRLVDDYQTHLKFEGREPRTLEELAVARADYEHRRRLAEIKALRPKLALLDAFLPALAQRGIKLAERALYTYDRGKTLQIDSPVFTKDNVLLQALIELGFREIGRRDWLSTSERVTLKHGRSLVVEIEVSKAQAGDTTKTTGSAS